MKNLQHIIFTVVVILFYTAIYAQKRPQNADSLRKSMMRFYGNRLKLDTGKAAQVMAIQETYKTGLKQLVARNPSEQQYRQAVAALMAEKNRQLAQLLTPEQQAMIIPTTERKPAQPAVTKH